MDYHFGSSAFSAAEMCTRRFLQNSAAAPEKLDSMCTCFFSHLNFFSSSSVSVSPVSYIFCFPSCFHLIARLEGPVPPPLFPPSPHFLPSLIVANYPDKWLPTAWNYYCATPTNQQHLASRSPRRALTDGHPQHNGKPNCGEIKLMTQQPFGSPINKLQDNPKCSFSKSAYVGGMTDTGCNGQLAFRVGLQA